MIKSPRTIFVALVLFAAAMLPVAAQASPGGQSWSPVEQATIRPGAVMITAGAQCTANFVFFDADDVYIGQAAHCAAGGSTGQPDGCIIGSMPLGTPVRVEGASHPGTLAYSSWGTMKALGEQDPQACAHNDFALVRLHRSDHSRVNPTMPHWGGPTGITDSLGAGSKVLSYGSSDLRAGIKELSPKQGFYQFRSGDGWGHTVFTVTPGIPGDSGSGFIDREGRAFGVVSTLIFLPDPLSNGLSDLSRALAYMHDHTELDDVQLALATEPFVPAPSLLDDALSPLPPLLQATRPIFQLLRILAP